MTPQEAYYKAINLGKRIPELEAIISQNAYWSYYYARDIIKGKFILAEPTISKNAEYSYYYAREVIKDRFILAEPVISKDARYSFCYALYVIKGKLPDFMHNRMILSNNKHTKEYIEYIK